MSSDVSFDRAQLTDEQPRAPRSPQNTGPLIKRKQIILITNGRCGYRIAVTGSRILQRGLSPV